MLVEPLLAHAQQTPDDMAIQDDAGSYTYRQLAGAAAAIAAHLSAITHRDNVGLMLPAGFGYVASFYGTLLAGKSVVPINFLLGEREIGHVIADSGIDTILSIPQLSARLKGIALKIIDVSQASTAPPSAPPPMPPKSADDRAVLIYTSGTSGLPKGVVLSYQNLQSDVDACIEHAQLQHKHKFLGVIPLFHAFGMTAMMLAPIQLAAPVIYMARFNPTAALNAIRDQSVALVFAIPSMFAAMAHLKNAAADDFKSIYALICGGEPLPAALAEQYLRRFGVTLYEGYGLTETSPVVSLNTPQAARPGSVGRPVPGVQVKIADDQGNTLPAGQNGEVWLKGKMVTKGYYKLPAETAAAMTGDGYFKTGDLGQLDADGFLYITGRKKELIIVAGEKAAPREIEEVLLRHEAVAEAAAVGKKDPTRGEVVVAFVALREGQGASADQLRDFCRDQNLVQWKIPREIFIEKDLPRSSTGKVLKRVLSQRVNPSA